MQGVREGQVSKTAVMAMKPLLLWEYKQMILWKSLSGELEDSAVECANLFPSLAEIILEKDV